MEACMYQAGDGTHQWSMVFRDGPGLKDIFRRKPATSRQSATPINHLSDTPDSVHHTSINHSQVAEDPRWKIVGNGYYIENQTSVYDLIEAFYDCCVHQSNKAYAMKRERYAHIYLKLDQIITNHKDNYDRCNPANKKRKQYLKFKVSQVERLYRRFETHCRQLKVIGFNSNTYDINLISSSLARILNKRKALKVKRPGVQPSTISSHVPGKKRPWYQCVVPTGKECAVDSDTKQDDEEGVDIEQLLEPDEQEEEDGENLELGDSFDFGIKKSAAKWLCFATKYVKFLDVKEYLPPSISLRSFLKCFSGEDTDDQKLFLPYEDIQEPADLEHTDFWSYEKFWSELSQENLLDEGISEEHGRQNHAKMAALYEQYSCQNRRDWLIQYQMADVRPFHAAVERLIGLYAELDVSLLDYLTLPSLAYNYAIKQTNGEIYNIPEFLQDWYYLLQSRITGGFSSLLNQPRAKIGDPINPDLYKDEAMSVQAIKCADFNSLYVAEMMENLPTGPPRVRCYPDFKLMTQRTRLENSRIGLKYVRWLAHSRGSDFAHAGNGREIVLHGRYPIDAYETKTGECYDFHGCHTHFHPGCKANKEPSDSPKTLAKHRADREKSEFIRSIGHNYHVKWECEFRQEMKNIPALKKFLEQQDHDDTNQDKDPNSTCFSTNEKIDKDLILKKVKDGSFFGFIVVNAHIKPECREKYDAYPIMIDRRRVTKDDLQGRQRETAEQQGMAETVTVMGVNEVNDYLVISEQVKFWLSLESVVITHISQVVEYTPKPVLRKCMEELAELRRQGDKSPDREPVGQIAKLIGNSAYGRSLLRRDKFTKMVICNQEDRDYLMCLPEFRKANPLLLVDDVLECLDLDKPHFVESKTDPDMLYEVHLAQKHVWANTPVVLGAYILYASKLRNMKCVELMKKYLIPRSWTLAYCDTDSLFFVLAFDTIDDCVIPHLREEWYKEVRQTIFVRDFCPKCIQDYVNTKTHPEKYGPWVMEQCCKDEHMWYLRQPGLLKIEYNATAVHALNPKTYILNGTDGSTKMGHKGVQARATKGWTIETFRNVSDRQQTKSATNRGFRKVGPIMCTWESTKTGLNPLDKKRKQNDTYPDITHIL